MNHDNYNNIFDRANGIPALLAIADPLDERNTMRIIKDKLRRFKIDTMLFPIAPIFCLMPLKSNHMYLHYRKYIIVCQETALL